MSSCGTFIRQSESNFKAAQNLVKLLGEKFKFSFEEGWPVVCETPVDKLQRKFKKDRKKLNPYRAIKKPRTAFSFFTQTMRSKIAADHPTSSFGEVSKHVSVAWKKLSDKERTKYTKMESSDKERYQKERDELKSKLESQPAGDATTTEASPEPTSEPDETSTESKKRTTSKGKGGKSTPKSDGKTTATKGKTASGTKGKSSAAKGKGKGKGSTKAKASPEAVTA